MGTLADCLGKVRMDLDLRDEVRALGSAERAMDDVAASLADLQEQLGVSPEFVTLEDLADLAPAPSTQSDPAQRALDQSGLSPEAREWVAALDPADRALIADSIAARPALADPKGDLGNLQQALILAKHRGLREMYRAATMIRVPISGATQIRDGQSPQQAAAAERDRRRAIQETPTERIERPRELEQAGDIKRGYIILGGERFARIQLTRDANLSTFLHETAHYFLEVWGALAQDAQTDQGFRDEYAKILQWLGVSSRDEIQVEHHEKWARAYEAYLREGKAPSSALRRSFARFRAWLSAIYRNVTRLGVKLNDDIRSIFDKTLATDDEIAEAQGLLDGRPVFTSAEAAGMTADEFAAYLAAFADADAQAKVVLSRRQLREEARETRKWWNEERKAIEAKVREEVNQTKVYQALAILRTGKLADGSPLPEGQQPFKLDRAALIRDFGEDLAGRLPRGVAGQDGMDPTQAADLLGYGSAVDLVNALANARPKGEVIAAETDLRMRERYGDLQLDGRIPEEAMKAVHNPERGRVLAREVRALSSQVGQSPTPAEVFRQAAERQASETLIRDLRPHRFRVAELRAGRKAFEAAAKGDWATAFAEKQRELLNHELFRAISRAKDRAEKTVRRLRKLTKKPAQERLAKAGKQGGTYLEQINNLLAAYELRNVPRQELDARRADAMTGLAAFAKQLDDSGVPHAIPTEVLQAAPLVNWRELTAEQFEALRDAIDSLQHAARGESELILANERANLEQVAGAVAGSILANAKAGEGHAVFADDQGLRGKLRKVKQDVVGLLLNPDTIIRTDLDGGQPGGAAHKHLKQVLDNAVREKLVPMMAEAGEAIDRIQQAYSRKELAAMRKRNISLPELKETVSKWEIIALALNWGNEGNREAVIKSGIFTQKGGDLFTVQRILDAHMDKRDWQFVQALLDYVDSYWPQIAAAQKRRTGVAPKKVEATPIYTPHGTFRGGYFPLIYDHSKSLRHTAHELEQLAQDMRSGNFAKAATRNGHTKERVGSGGKPVLFDAGNVQRHLMQVIRDLAIGDEIRYVARVLSSEQVQGAFEATGQEATHRVLDLWLKDVAVGEMVHGDVLSRTFRYVRSGFAVSKMAFNLKVAALQMTGFAHTAVVAGRRNTLLGLKDLLGRSWWGPNSAAAEIQSLSPFMAKRAETFQKDLMDTLAAVKGKGWRETLTRWGFVPIQRMQLLVDMATWMAGRRQAIGLGMQGADVIRHADSVVAQSQASGIFSDRSAVERGTLGTNVRQVEFVRMMTTLKSYLLLKYSIAYEKTRSTEFRNPLSALRWASDMLLLFTFEGMLTYALTEMLAGDDGDDDEDWMTEMAAAAGKETAKTLLGGIPLVGQTVSAIEGFAGGNADANLANAVAKVWTQAEQGEIDRAAVKAVVDLAGLLFHLPSTQPNRVLDAIWRDAEGEEVAPIEYLIGRPPPR